MFAWPAPYLVGTLAVLGWLYLLASLPGHTLIRFLAWNGVGLLVYLAYGQRRSLAGRAAAARA